jgi:LmbE family N-acetylglucosaminyl deacetylase
MKDLIRHNVLPLQTIAFPKTFPILVLAPHPDDFDAIGMTMRFFKQNGNPLHLAVATTGAGGVEDTFCSPPTSEMKTEIREQEQLASCRFFGLPEPNLMFLRLQENKNGQFLQNGTDIRRVNKLIYRLRPTIIFLPHWNDTNRTHKHVYAIFQQVARKVKYPLVAFLNRDPKTIQMRYDVYMEFGKKEAIWKGELLRLHRSQQQRNLNQRGYGMDDRILQMDRESAKSCLLKMPYAEVFELEFYRAKTLEDILK